MSNFAEYAVDLLGAVGRVVARRMFGGYGLYCDAVMFALIADDVLYLKADEANRLEFKRAGSEPFTYEAKGRRTIMAYWRMPDEAMESREVAASWARGALAAALRARAAKRPRRKTASRPKRVKTSRRSRATPFTGGQLRGRGSRAGGKR